MEVDLDLVREVVDILKNSGVREITVEWEGKKVRVKRNNNVVATTTNNAGNHSQPAIPEKATELPAPSEPEPTVVRAPWVGFFHCHAANSEEPLVRVDQQVRKGQAICYVESVSVMNEVLAPCAGVVTEITAEEDYAVEYGQPLLLLGSDTRRE